MDLSATGEDSQCTVWERFDQVANSFPDKIAVIYPDDTAPRQWCYRDLASYSKALAAALLSRGVREGDIVAVAADRQLETIGSYLAIAMIGAAYLPIDPGWPPARVQSILDDAQPRLILVGDDAEIAAGPIETASLRDLGASDSGVTPVSRGSSDTPLYVMYTSGSTGAPKGVLVPHRGAIRLVCGADYCRLDAQCVFLQMSPLSFDLATLEIWGPLLNGGTCVLFPQAGAPDLETLRRIVQTHDVTSMWLTSSLFNGIIAVDPSVLEGVNTILVGGEPVSVPHTRAAQAALPKATFINGYGPTENTTFSTCFTIPNPVPEAWTTMPIGTSISGSTAYVLDENGAPVNDGETGELYVGGLGVALGYLNRMELTAERFTEDPFVGVPGRLMYKTGDFVRDRGDGVLLYLGRKDNQVKIRGNRVELEEIEAILYAHPGVRDVCVRVKVDANGEKHLVVYLVGENVELADLSAALKHTLPAAVVPSHLVQLDRMPLTENGKLDSARLPNPFGAPAPNEQMQTPVPGGFLAEETTWNSASELVETLWSRVLPPGTAFTHRDSFFEVGGTSVGAVQIAARLSKELNRPVPVVKLFEFPTIEKLVAYLEGAAGPGDQNASKERAALAREARRRRRESR